MFARSLFREWKHLRLPLTNASIVVAVSGGADSTALLLALAELIQNQKLSLHLTVACLDHRLRGKAGGNDARWVKSLAARLGYRARIARANVGRRAKQSGDNLEQQARRVRYAFLARTARTEGADFVLTGHTRDDQAETVLLNLIRGSGTDGLSGMDSIRTLDKKGKLLLARPLLSWAGRTDTEEYCRLRGVEFRLDTMNIDEQFARVRVRRQLLPLMKTFNPRVIEALSRAADLLREDKAALEGAATRLLQLATRNKPENKDANEASQLWADMLRIAPSALRRRALRQWISRGRGDLRRIELAHIRAVETLLDGARGGRTIELPGGARVSRNRGWLQFRQ